MMMALTVHHYAVYNWEGVRVYHLFSQTLYLLRRFTGGWTYQSAGLARKLLVSCILKLREKNHVRYIKNNVGASNCSSACLNAACD